MTAEEILKELLLDHCIEDFIYDVKSNEGEGWDGPRVTRFVELIDAAKQLLGIEEDE